MQLAAAPFVARSRSSLSLRSGDMPNRNFGVKMKAAVTTTDR
jgi:hypothetical protein